ncbi:MAG: T9SS type A sorting domain-containing protein [Bacteroidales bacterium]|nr:T9SS type A sorting domain-containing protein [Bacteroidales bacterium]MCF8337052.1 T9SS type A sorting domain-containing protein [Bacteroidales bacterium]
MKKLILLFAIILLHPTYSFSQEWSEPVLISTMEGHNENPDFIIDHEGILHCVWNHEVEDNFYKLYYSKSEDNGETWSEPEDILGNDSLWMADPHLAVDSENNLYLSYDYNAGNPGAMQVLFRTYTGSNWSEPDTISADLYGSMHNKLIIDNNDRIYVFWYRPESIYYRYFENNSWSEIQCPYNNDNLYFLEKAVVDSNNNLHCTGSFHYEGQSGYDDRIIYFKYTYEDNQWSEVTILSDDTSWQGNDIDLDNDDLPHIAWGQYTSDSIPPNDGTFYSYYNGNNWTTPELIVEDPEHQTIAIDSQNQTHITDEEKTETGYQLVHYYKCQENWNGQIIDTAGAALANSKLIYYQNQLYTVYIKSPEPTTEHINIVFSRYEIPSGVGNEIPYTYYLRLKQNYPNPFKSKTTIPFEINKSGHTTLKIFDLKGKLIKTLVNSNKRSGAHHAMWNGKDQNGKEVNSGLYLYRLQVGRHVMTRSLEVLK